MTSDAKIGLLLGLVFIFVIAFVINGMPSFRDATNGSELTTNMVSSQNGSWAIGANERKVQEGFDWTGRPIEESLEREVRPPVEEVKEDIRFKMPIPDDIAIVQESPTQISPELIEQTPAVTDEAAGPEPQLALASVAQGAEPIETLKTVTVELPAVEKQPEPKPAGPVMPKIYVIRDGDNLGSITKKFYGPEEGNKPANIRRIFEANRKTLKSMDDVFPGQKILIPPLNTSRPDVKKTESVFANSLFEEVKSIGNRLLSADKPKPQPKPNLQYVVQDGDNLWRLAAVKLGDGTRYKEIVELNPDVLKDENTTLDIGMRLRLPAQ